MSGVSFVPFYTYRKRAIYIYTENPGLSYRCIQKHGKTRYFTGFLQKKTRKQTLPDSLFVNGVLSRFLLFLFSFPVFPINPFSFVVSSFFLSQTFLFFVWMPACNGYFPNRFLHITIFSFVSGLFHDCISGLQKKSHGRDLSVITYFCI